MTVCISLYKFVSSVFIPSCPNFQEFLHVSLASQALLHFPSSTLDMFFSSPFHLCAPFNCLSFFSILFLCLPFLYSISFSLSFCFFSVAFYNMFSSFSTKKRALVAHYSCPSTLHASTGATKKTNARFFEKRGESKNREVLKHCQRLDFNLNAEFQWHRGSGTTTGSTDLLCLSLEKKNRFAFEGTAAVVSQNNKNNSPRSTKRDSNSGHGRS